MIRILLLLLTLLVGPALAQPAAIIPGQTPITSGSSGQCVTRSSGGVVIMATCIDGALPLAGGAMTGTLALKGYNESVQPATISSNVLTVDMNDGTIFPVTNNADLNTITILNPPAGKAFGFVLVVSNSGTANAQPAFNSIRWTNGSPAAFTGTAGAIDLVSIWTYDGGSTLFGAAALNQVLP